MMKENLLKSILQSNIGFIGLGQMGNALLLNFTHCLKQLTNNENLVKESFHLYVRDPKKIDFYNKLGYKNLVTLESMFKNCEIIFLCVKPDIISEILYSNKRLLRENTLLISVAAGISIGYIQSFLEKPSKIIRIMTNHLCLIGQGATVYCVNKQIVNLDEEFLKLLFSSNGIIDKIDEKLMNAFTAFASSPAFIYSFLEAIIDGGIKNGIPYQQALDHGIQIRKLKLTKVYGASIMLKDYNKNPYNLKYQVTTPGGTTIEGLSSLEKNGFKSAIIEAISASTNRAKQINQEKILSIKPKL